MKLKTFCTLFLLAGSTLIASPRKCPAVVKCTQVETALQADEADREGRLADDTDFLPLHRFSGSVL